MNSSNEQIAGVASRPHGEQTRRRLLAAAAEMIAGVGWGRVTTRAVAERAGLPLGTVSYHFHGKQEMLRQAALCAVEDVMPLSELAAMERLPDLIRLVKTAVGNSSDPVVSAVLMETMREAARDPALRERMASLLADYRRALAELVRAEQRRGVVPADADPEALAVLVAGAGDGLLLHGLVDPELDLGAAVEVLLRLLGSFASERGTGR